MRHRLIIVEGLPCSGKSTTSKIVFDILQDRGFNVNWVDEGTGEHPADYEFHSYLTVDDLYKFKTWEQEELLNLSSKEGEGYIIPLGKLSGDLFNQVLQYKIYDYLPWEKEKNLMLDKWRKFTTSVNDDIIYVFNCCFLQNPMCETMMRFGFNYEVSKDYVENIWDIIKVLNPLIIYLSEDEVYDRIQTASNERGKEWMDAVIHYHMNGEYGKSMKLEGYNGYITCLEERQKRELKILNDMECDHIVFNNCSKHWDQTYYQLKETLNK